MTFYPFLFYSPKNATPPGRLAPSYSAIPFPENWESGSLLETIELETEDNQG